MRLSLYAQPRELAAPVEQARKLRLFPEHRPGGCFLSALLDRLSQRGALWVEVGPPRGANEEVRHKSISENLLLMKSLAREAAGFNIMSGGGPSLAIELALEFNRWREQSCR